MDELLKSFLPTSSDPLHEAMRYSVLGGGKRLRAKLVFAAGDESNALREKLNHAACAVEFIHAYSLIHDDLPAMDNDDFRRGKPSCHKVYGDAIAILAGDALQSLAFEILAKNNDATLIKILAEAIGPQGMVLGQSLDIQKKDNTEELHLYKTAKLIISSIQLGALCGNVSDEKFHQLTEFGKNLGLAFQYQDDVLDGEKEKQEKAEFYYQKALIVAHGQLKDITVSMRDRAS